MQPIPPQEDRKQAPKSFRDLQKSFIRNVNHELRTPVAIIHGYAELLTEGTVGSLAPEQQSVIFAIRNSARNLRAVVEHITTLLVIEATGVAAGGCDLREVVAAVVGEAPAAQSHPPVTLQLPAQPVQVAGQPYYLRQAVECLIDNAQKFTSQEGRIEVSVAEEGEWGRLTVTDTGIGIPAGEQSLIFEPFYQCDDAPTRRFGGMGLGLAVVKAVAEAYAGQIEIASRPEQGSRFTLKIPLARPEAKDTMEKDAPPPQRILIVDDEESILITLQASLEALPNCEVFTASNGEEAQRLFEQHPFDLLMTDYKMPGMDGLSLAAWVRQRYPETAIIMITAHSDDQLHQAMESIAIRHLLNKPVEFSEIRRVTAKILGEKHRP